MQRSYIVIRGNKHLSAAIQQMVFDAGSRWQGGETSVWPDTVNALFFQADGRLTRTYSESQTADSKGDYKEITTVAELLAVIEEIRGMIVPLRVCGYQLELDDAGNVKLGCKFVPWETVEKIYARAARGEEGGRRCNAFYCYAPGKLLDAALDEARDRGWRLTSAKGDFAGYPWLIFLGDTGEVIGVREEASVSRIVPGVATKITLEQLPERLADSHYRLEVGNDRVQFFADKHIAVGQYRVTWEQLQAIYSLAQKKREQSGKK